MDKKTKLKIKYGIFSGLGFAGFMAGFDFLDGEGFRLFRFMINFLFFVFWNIYGIYDSH